MVHNESGWIIPDTQPSTVGAHLLALSESPEIARKVIVAAQQVAQRHTWDDNASGVMEVYERTMEHP